MSRKSIEFTYLNFIFTRMWLLLVIVSFLFFMSCGPKTPSSESSGDAAKGSVEIKFATWDIESSFTVPHYRWFAEELEKRTGGHAKMQIFLAGSLGSTSELPENLQKGIADMAVFVPTHVPGLMPVAELMSVPLLIPTAPVMDYIGWHLISEGLLDLPGVKILEIMGHEDLVLFTTKKKVTSLNDFKGLVLASNGTWATLSSKLGASEMLVPPPEIYTSVERGVVDGGVFGWGLPRTLKMEGLLKYIVSDSLGNDPWIIGMNMDKWNSLPPDIKVILLDLTREAGHKLRAIITEENKIAANHFKAVPGTQINSFNPGEYERLVQIALPLAQKKAEQLDKKGVPASKALKIIINDLKALGTLK